MKSQSFHFGASRRSADSIDFNDVFGGPPRRFSPREVRARRNVDEVEDSEERSSISTRCLKEKSVFGEVSNSKRHSLSEDFFNDIYGGDESPSSPRTYLDGDDGSWRFTSPPARNSTPKPENLSSSFPHKFSVSARLDEGNELPGVGNRRGNGGTSGIRGSPSSSSRSQNRIFQGHEDDKSIFHQGHLPQESSLRYSRSLPYSVTPDQKGNPGRRMRNDEGIVDDDTDCHFSFYKWASNGIPVLKLMHILDGNCMKSKKGDVVVGAPQFSRTGPEKKDARTQRGARKNLEDFFRETLDGVYDLKVSGVDDESVITNAEDMEGAKGETELAEAFSQFADTRDLADVLRESQDERTEVVNSSHSRSAAAAANTPKERWDAEWQRDADHKPDDSSKASENLKCEKEEKRSAASSREMLHPDTVCSPESDIDPFEVNFMVEVLSEDPETVAPPTKIESTKIHSCISDSVQEIDAKIRNWSAGKKGNIQSLLSTLQFVLWPGSGWKPVPLVDLLEANSIRRAYQKAMLQLHPDKLQQRSAAFHQKYLAEKVFEILQEAWDHFSTVAHV